ncbi:MAG: hypothetical protein QG639_1110 [Patescibacteria group bacterium]|jgi:hypothetical protein|nr:hypothetical protein [Patescibacteria group bacterium]
MKPNFKAEKSDRNEATTVSEYLQKLSETLSIVRSQLGEEGWWVIGSNARRGLLQPCI